MDVLRARAAGQGGVEGLAEVGREPEAEPAFDGDDFGSGQTGGELDLVDRGTAHHQSEPLLGAAEIVDQFLQGAVIHMYLALLPKAAGGHMRTGRGTPARTYASVKRYSKSGGSRC